MFPNSATAATCYDPAYREYLCSEVVHGLGIPATRALCLIRGEEEVYREQFAGAFLHGKRDKLGLLERRGDGAQLIDDLPSLMAANGSDDTRVFRSLGEFRAQDTAPGWNVVGDRQPQTAAYAGWLDAYRARLLRLLRAPFFEQQTMEGYARQPPDWARDIVLSCSS